MCEPISSDDRADRAAAAVGGAVWATTAAAAAIGLAPLGIVEVLLVGGPLVVVPLGLALARPEPAGATAVGARSVAAALVVVSFVVPAGALAALVTVPWLACTGVLGPAAIRLATGRREDSDVHARRRGSRLDAPDRFEGIGMLWLPLAAIAITLTRGWPAATIASIAPELVRLTGVHLVFAGFGASVIAAQVARAAASLDRSGRGTDDQRRRLVATASGSATVGGALVVAVGHLTARPVELVGALGMTAGVIGLGVAAWSLAPPRSAARVLLRISGLSVLGSMGFAVAYAWALTIGAPHLPYTTIAAIHGTINALGFTVAGLLGWCAGRGGEPVGQVSRRVRSSKVSRRTTTRDRPSRTKTTAGRGRRL